MRIRIIAPSAIPSALLLVAVCQGQLPDDYPIRAVPLSEKHVHDSFWKPRLEINRSVSIPHNFEQCKLTGRIDAFLLAAQGKESVKKGPSWWDSDVYKVVEAASYCLRDHPHPELANYLDLLVSVIATAQEDDGYLHTFRTIDPRHEWNGGARFTHPISHELFNAGHLYEAAVAHYQATGRRDLLDVALRNAELLWEVFGGREFGEGGPDILVFQDHPQFDFGERDFSLQLWFKPHAASRMGLFSGATDHWFGIDFHNRGDRNICLYASTDGIGWDLIHADSGGAGIGEVSLELDQWHHIVVVREGDNWKTYINNQLDLDITATGMMVTRDEDKQIGMWADVGNWVNGVIDQFAIFDVALTPEQVEYYHTHPVTPKPQEPRAVRPIGLWTMDEGAGRTVHDLSGSENHASIRGAEWVADAALPHPENRSLNFVGDGTGYKNDHPEIELALVKLYRTTGRERYLKLTKYLCDHKLAAWRYPRDATHYDAREHVVASSYAWCGMTDLLALGKAPEYRKVIDSIWDNVVSRKMYLTGGIGSRGELFAEDYVLPNSGLESATPPSVETCGAIGFALWSHRMFCLYGDAQYIDVLERTLYNAFPPNVSLAGDTFSYANPLIHDAKMNFNMGFVDRQPFLPSACCPTNVVRFFPQIPNLIYAQRQHDVYVNLFIDSHAEFDIEGTPVELRQKTNYPQDGRVEIHLAPERAIEFPLRVRIPGWSRNQPVPSDLYRYLNPYPESAEIRINGKPLAFTLDQGYAVVNRSWEKGDTLVLKLPMPVRRVICHDKVVSNRGRVALQRGPLVYCAEGADNSGSVLDLVLPDDAQLQPGYWPQLLNGVVVIEARAEHRKFNVVPYHSWLNRGQNEMTVWYARTAP